MTQKPPMRCDSETKECRDQSVRHGGIYEGRCMSIQTSGEVATGYEFLVKDQRVCRFSAAEITLFLSFLVSIQQQHTAADRGQG